jgi:MoaA/NifB/PqqE/SkfB family radical SAM enzyme
MRQISHKKAMSLSRKRGWFTETLSPGKAWNMFLAGCHVALRSQRVWSYPVALKMDISPLCNIHCLTCIHAKPHMNPRLEAQSFCPDQKMPIDQFQRVIDECRGKTSSVTLHYLGDPLMVPNIHEYARYVRDTGMTVHINTNLSYNLSDERLKLLVTSGLTHLTVCLDGMTQETYGRTRVGGRIDIVTANLRKICQLRRELDVRHLHIEVQYLKYQHNAHEIPQAEAFCRELGVDQFTEFWAHLGNYVYWPPVGVEPKGVVRRRLMRPLCLWPYGAMVIKYNGEVVPCCGHRLGTQYVKEGQSPVLGNVFKTSVREVWNSPPYRRLRRLVFKPQPALNKSAADSEFCYGCIALVLSNYKRPRGNKHHIEEFYEVIDGVLVCKQALTPKQDPTK